MQSSVIPSLDYTFKGCNSNQGLMHSCSHIWVSILFLFLFPAPLFYIQDGLELLSVLTSLPLSTGITHVCLYHTIGTQKLYVHLCLPLSLMWVCMSLSFLSQKSCINSSNSFISQRIISANLGLMFSYEALSLFLFFSFESVDWLWKYGLSWSLFIQYIVVYL